MTIGILKEPASETRVSLLPEAVATLTKKGITVLAEQGAGEKSFSQDEDYTSAGAQVQSREEVIRQSDILLAIHPPADPLSSKKIIIGVYQPLFVPAARCSNGQRQASPLSVWICFPAPPVRRVWMC